MGTQTIFVPEGKGILSVEMAAKPFSYDASEEYQPPDFELPNTSYGMNGQNGRVNFTEVPSAGGFLRSPEMGFVYRTAVEENASENLLRGNWAENTLSKAFFGQANTKIIQNAIRRSVFEKSGDKKWVIDEQSVDELQIVMRSIYLQYAKNWDTQIPEQIKDLNNLVVEWCVPRIMSEIEFHEYYIQDISHMPVPLSQPVSLSSAGTKSLPFRRFM